MEKEENIVSYTSEELRAMCARGEDRTDWARVAEIEASGIDVYDEKEEGYGEVDWSKAIISHPQNKKHINLRVDADVLKFFKAGGKGYQTRMNAVLRSYVMANVEG